MENNWNCLYQDDQELKPWNAHKGFDKLVQLREMKIVTVTRSCADPAPRVSHETQEYFKNFIIEQLTSPKALGVSFFKTF